MDDEILERISEVGGRRSEGRGREGIEVRGRRSEVGGRNLRNRERLIRSYD